jgi:hypothetical protein
MSCLITSIPTQRTKERLSEILMSAPISIDLEKLYLPLWYGEEDSPTVKSYKSKGPYESRFDHFKMAWNALRNHSELDGFLSSPNLKQRALELGSSDSFPIRLVFLDHSPPMSRTNKSFIASVSDTLVTYEFEPFTFEQDFMIRI